MKPSLITDDTILDRDDVARWLKVEPREVQRLVKKKGLPCLPLGNKTLRFFRADVLAWLQQQRKAS
jgi:excisionase family DNA binding protein